MSEDSEGEAIRHWWRTAIIDMAPGKIHLRGRPIEQLIGHLTFAQMVWLLLRGDLPEPAQARLLEHALVAGVDHGPQAPSIAVARMAATCGIGLNNVMGSAINLLGDTHGGAGEQCAQLFYQIDHRMERGEGLEQATVREMDHWRTQRSKIIPGYGHRFHREGDPRVPRLMELTQQAQQEGWVTGRFVAIAHGLGRQLAERTGRMFPLNIDGVTAMIYCELGFPAALARGLFCLSRAVGVLAHAWEQMQQGERNKGPMPPRFLPQYTGKKGDG